MCSPWRWCWCISSSYYLLWIVIVAGGGVDEQPVFVLPIGNQTVAVGRDASFVCVIDRLGEYKVAWFKYDTKAVLTMQRNLVSRDPRLSIAFNDQNTWTLTIRQVVEQDAGIYACQTSTVPPRNQFGYLEVLVPPDILDNETSTDLKVQEGQNVTLQCRARGRPSPKVTWKREDGTPLGGIRSPAGGSHLVRWEAGDLAISRIHRSDAGAFLCEARNGVPPTVSKRIVVQVLFPPRIKVTSQLVVAPLDSAVMLECIVEAFPPAKAHWQRRSGEVMGHGEGHSVDYVVVSEQSKRLLLYIDALSAQDLGSYVCVAKNDLGTAEGLIRIHEMLPPSTEALLKITRGHPSTSTTAQYRFTSPVSKRSHARIYTTVATESTLDPTIAEPVITVATWQLSSSSSKAVTLTSVQWLSCWFVVMKLLWQC